MTNRTNENLYRIESPLIDLTARQREIYTGGMVQHVNQYKTTGTIWEHRDPITNTVIRRYAGLAYDYFGDPQHATLIQYNPGKRPVVQLPDIQLGHPPSMSPSDLAHLSKQTAPGNDIRGSQAIPL